MVRHLSRFAVALAAVHLAHGQEAVTGNSPTIARSSTAPSGAPAAITNAPAISDAPPKSTLKPGDVGFTPTWETQKHARTYVLGIPAPRGQITDRNGEPLAQTRVSYNLCVAFPTPLNFSEQEVLRFAEKQVLLARSLTGRMISLSGDTVLKHYKNRGVLPMVIARDLSADELARVNRAGAEHLRLQPIYLRHYPNGRLAAHIIGYAGRAGREPDGPIENNELLWPNAEGREGIEQSFDDQLQGKIGQFNISFDATGRKASEQVSVPPQPGYNVVTTIDAKIQRLCEETLASSCKRGAMVLLDPNSGDVIAMATWPTFDPNLFIPAISHEKFRELNDHPDKPLIPRAYRSAYPPGSTFKVFVGLAAMQSGKVEPDDLFSCPPSLQIGNLTFRNWKKTNAGMLNFADALTQSCNTWFYQVGQKLGGNLMSDYAQQLGLGMRTGIPLDAETPGRIPDEEYMLRVYKRRFMPGDNANFSIGQGDILISPLQMAQAMGAIGNGGTLLATRLVKQVQSIDNQIITAYDVRARSYVNIDKKTLRALRQGMIQVVSSRMGTAGRASVPGVSVAGKTGTAQWGPKNNERTAAWFAGFVPADHPKYAFAAVYEGDAKNDDVHGGTEAAPMIGKVLRELFKQEKKKPKKRGKKTDDEENEEQMKPDEEAGDIVAEDGTPVRRAQPVIRDED